MEGQQVCRYASYAGTQRERREAGIGGTHVRKFAGKYAGTREAGKQVSRYAGTQVRRHAGKKSTLGSRYAGTQVRRFGGTQVRKYGSR